jgi:hypothetical protein
VKGQLGETLHQVAEQTDVGQLIAAHLGDASIMAQEESLLRQLGSFQFEPIAMVASQDTALLSTHGVADGSKVLEAFHPVGMSLVASIADEDVFLVTKDFKVIDVAAHVWPIDVDNAKDYRTQILAPIQFGDHVGVVAGCLEDHVIMRSQSQIVVPLQDVKPVMVDRTYRKLIGGV